jgi:glycolate oxidase iron-sulfur subunit
MRAQPRQLLRGVPGLDLREVAEAELCCGSAVIYNILHPGPARELGDLRTADPGC